MKSKIIITLILVFSFIGLLILANGIKKDSANLEYIPSFTADSAPTEVSIEGLDERLLDVEGRAFINNVLYDYIIKYEPNPTNTYSIDTGNTIKGSVDENGVATTSFLIKDNKNQYRVVYATDPNIWMKVTITNTETKESYSSVKNISESSF